MQGEVTDTGVEGEVITTFVSVGGMVYVQTRVLRVQYCGAQGKGHYER